MNEKFQAAATFEGSLVGREIAVLPSMEAEFKTVYGPSGFRLRETYTVTADEPELVQTRVLEFVDHAGRRSFGDARRFHVVDYTVLTA